MTLLRLDEKYLRTTIWGLRMRKSWPSLSISTIVALLTTVLVSLPTESATAAELPVNEAIQGNWTGVFVSVTKFGFNGGECGRGTLWVEVDGLTMRGNATHDDGGEFIIFGDVTEIGAIEEGFAIGSTNTATFRGTFSDGTLSGVFVDALGCKGTWITAKE